jgi:hypothetical protein
MDELREEILAKIKNIHKVAFEASNVRRVVGRSSFLIAIAALSSIFGCNTKLLIKQDLPTNEIALCSPIPVCKQPA